MPPTVNPNIRGAAGAGGMNPLVGAALVQAGASFLAGLFGGDDDGAELAAEVTREEGRANRRLSRDEILIELLTESIATDQANRAAQRNANLSAPHLAALEEMRWNASPQTVARNNAYGRAAPEGPGGDSARALVAENFTQFQQMRDTGRQMAQRITPESLYVGRADPLDEMARRLPEVDARMRSGEPSEEGPQTTEQYWAEVQRRWEEDGHTGEAPGWYAMFNNPGGSTG